MILTFNYGEKIKYIDDDNIYQLGYFLNYNNRDYCQIMNEAGFIFMTRISYVKKIMEIPKYLK